MDSPEGFDSEGSDIERVRSLRKRRIITMYRMILWIEHRSGIPGQMERRRKTLLDSR